MKLFILLCSAALCFSVAFALDTRFFDVGGRRDHPRPNYTQLMPKHRRRNATFSDFNTTSTKKFAVNGTGIPEVDFDVGESYAGQLPIGDKSNGSIYFWFWPTTNPDRPKEILLYLDGGPGCSSLGGMIQESGPFTWASGTFKPVANPWSWHHITNVVYIDQPIGTGFSTGPVTAENEDDVARQLMGFWKNFVDAFKMHQYTIYIVTESYGGMFGPYIGKSFLDTNNTAYFNFKGLLLNSPLISDLALARQVTASLHVDYWSNMFPLNETARNRMHSMSATCGFDEYISKYFTFPPTGPQPAILPTRSNDNSTDTRCDVFGFIVEAIMNINPGWNIYQVAQLLPIPSDVLGYPSALKYHPPGLPIYFDRSDVKAAINAPATVSWTTCVDNTRPVFVNETDGSPPSIFEALPSVIDRTGNVIIAHGMNDFVLQPQGTLLAIQNMTWGGELGFQRTPADPLFVPYHWYPENLTLDNFDYATLSGQGVMGTTHTERGLTWALVMLAGHMIPTWQTALSYRQVEVLVGRASNLSSTQPLGLYPNINQPSRDSLGVGTAPVFGRVVDPNHASTSSD
ncbi:alpha/beta-hydrolase [Thozetella sp. PMI_491]|nr:alpha/beta-hydrolase [Thozetella sp. PMI_491]